MSKRKWRWSLICKRLSVQRKIDHERVCAIGEAVWDGWLEKYEGGGSEGTLFTQVTTSTPNSGSKMRLLGFGDWELIRKMPKDSRKLVHFLYL